MLKVIASLISYCPLPMIYGLSDILAPMAGLLYRRKVVDKNLRQVFPLHSPKTLKAIRKEFYRNLLDTSLETFKSLRFSEKELEGRMKVVEDAVYLEAVSSDEPFLIYCAHYGNWEWLIQRGGEVLPCIYFMYKPLKSQGADQLMLSIRSRTGSVPVATQETRKILKDKGIYKAVAMVADQSPHRSNPSKIWAKFFQQETPFYQGIFVLPYLTQLPAYYAALKRVSRGYYEVELKLLGKPGYKKNDFSVLKNYLAVCEEQIKNNPADWLWSHNRWKYRRPKDEPLLDFAGD